jgi:hypothetical protein
MNSVIEEDRTRFSLSSGVANETFRAEHDFL